MKTKAPLQWFGSDAGVSPRLAAIFDHCKHVTIGMVGGGAIIPHLKARAIVANDLHQAAINFYKHLTDPSSSERLISLCKHTLSHPDELRAAVSLTKGGCYSVYHAWAYWAVCWLGRKGKGGTKHQGGNVSIRRTAGGGTNATRISAAADDLQAWASLLKERCEWDNRCFRETHPKIADVYECGLYDDPPWQGAGRNYLHSFTPQDYKDLAKEHHRFEDATVVLRIDDTPFIRGLYTDDRWRIIETESRTQANSMAKEIWITNSQKGGEE